MRKSTVLLGLLGAALLSAQTTDSIKENTIDAVILNTIVKKDTESSHKMPLKFIENPQVYSSVDKTVLENQNLFTVDEALRNVTGLQKMWNATHRSGDGGSYVNLRGFIASNSMRNGMVSPVSSTIDAINIEKVEVLKGPSATLYGSNGASYGGLINRITKKPLDHFQGSVSLAGGSNDFARVQSDVNVPLNRSRSLLLRLNTAYTTESSFQNAAAKSHYYAFAPSLLWNVSDKLNVLLDYEGFESRTQAEQNLFFIFSPSLYGYKDMYDIEKLGLNYNESYISEGLYNTGRSRNLIGQINYRISEKVKSTTLVSSSYSYSDGYNPYFYITTESYTPDQTPLGLYRGDQSTRDSKQKIFQIQQNFNLDFPIGSMRNRVLVGADYMRSNSDQLFVYGIIDFVPLSGADYSGFNKETLENFYKSGAYGSYPMQSIKDTYSAYVSDVLSVTEKLKVMAALRFESNDFKGGVIGTPVASYNQSALSPKLGLVYEVIPEKFSVFGNYQNSFKSNGYYISDASETLVLSDPETANQFEAGLKTNLLQGRLNATVSYYDIDVRNSLQTVGYTSSNLAIQDQMAALESKGVELELNAYLVKGFSVIAGLSYNDSRYKDTADETILNRRPNTASSPWLANFSANYQFLDGRLKGLGMGMGGNYASANRIFNTTTAQFELPSYLVLNANAFYDQERYRIGLSVNNFTNEKHWIGYTTANPQKLRNGALSFTYKF